MPGIQKIVNNEIDPNTRQTNRIEILGVLCDQGRLEIKPKKNIATLGGNNAHRSFTDAVELCNSFTRMAIPLLSRICKDWPDKEPCRRTGDQFNQQIFDHPLCITQLIFIDQTCYIQENLEHRPWPRPICPPNKPGGVHRNIDSLIDLTNSVSMELRERLQYCMNQCN